MFKKLSERRKLKKEQKQLGNLYEAIFVIAVYYGFTFEELIYLLRSNSPDDTKNYKNGK